MPGLSNIISLIQNSKNTLFILCGFPYAGKSFIAKQLLEQTDITFVSIDEIFHQHGFDWNSNTLPDTGAWEQIFNESYEQTKQALRGRNNVLYDSTNQTVASRNKLREIADVVGADTKVVFIKSPTETIWERWNENRKNPSRSVVNRDLIEMTIDMFEEPTEEEHVIVINN